MTDPTPSHDSWFNRSPQTAPSSGRLSDIPEPPRAGAPGWSMVTGLVCGAAGGVVMVLASAAVAQRYHANADVQGAIGRALGSLGGRDPNLAALVLAAAVGALLGAVFGRMTRRLFKIPARMFFGAVLAPVLWLLIHAFVLLRFAPRMAEALPVGSMCIGALVYGLCVSVIPPFDRRRRKA